MLQSLNIAIVQPIKDFLFVTECFHCGTRLLDNESRICARCWSTMTLVGENDYTINVLRERFKEGGVIDELVSLFYFEKGKLLQSLAHSLKYQELTIFGFELGVRVSEKLQGKEFDILIPVPLNKRKERERGYNQSDFIAKGISSVLNVPFDLNVVRRDKYTVTQTHLNAEQRKDNIAEAFSVVRPEKINGKNILIVDDIITTGATIQELARVLKIAGARNITAVSAGLAKLGNEN